MLYAVATGDIVNSTMIASDERRDLPRLLRTSYEETTKLLAGVEEPLPIDLFGGDSWQFCLPDPQRVLAVLTYFRAALFAKAGLRTRCAIAIDSIDFLNRTSISESDGPAFRRSGRLLKTLTETELSIVLPEGVTLPSVIACDALARLADNAYRNWTDAQAKAVMYRSAGVLRGKTISQSIIAENWEPAPITQQAVAKHLSRAEWESLNLTLSDFQRLINHIQERPTSAQK